MPRIERHPAWGFRCTLRVRYALLFAALLTLTQCLPDEGADRGKKFVTVKLNDSLNRYDSVEILIFADGDTGAIVGEIWKGPLEDPDSVPAYRLDDGETRTLSIRVKGFEDGKPALDMILAQVDGKQIVTRLPLPPTPPSPPIPPSPPTPPKPSVRLAALTASPGVLTPAFRPGDSQYTLTLPAGDSSLTLTLAPEDSTAILRIGTVSAAAGKPSAPIGLAMGANKISISVAVGDSLGLYSINAIRSQRNPADTLPPDPDPDPNPEPEPDPDPDPDPGQSESYAVSWKHKALIHLDLDFVQLTDDSFLPDYPLLVRLDKAFFEFSQAADSGRDIRFATLDGRPLAYEVGQWDAKEGTALIWVKVDTLKGAEGSLHMYWGNPQAVRKSAPEQVFAPAAGYSGVWHLNEKGTGAAGEFKDAVGRAHGTGGSPGISIPPTRVAAEVGYGQDFHLGDSQTAVVLPNTFDPGANAWTFSAWVHRYGEEGCILFSKNEGEQADKHRFQIDCLGPDGRFLTVRRGGGAFQSQAFLEDGPFQLIGLTYDGKSASVYVNGELRESLAWTQGPNALAKAVLGSANLKGGKGFHGVMNEIWFSSKARSAAYMRMQYENQVFWSSMVSFLPF